MLSSSKEALQGRPTSEDRTQFMVLSMCMVGETKERKVNNFGRGQVALR